MFISSRQLLETLMAPLKLLEGSLKRSTFEILAEVEEDVTEEVELYSDEELGLSTVLGKSGDPA